MQMCVTVGCKTCKLSNLLDIPVLLHLLYGLRSSNMNKDKNSASVFVYCLFLYVCMFLSSFMLPLLGEWMYI